MNLIIRGTNKKRIENLDTQLYTTLYSSKQIKNHKPLHKDRLEFKISPCRKLNLNRAKFGSYTTLHCQHKMFAQK